jgi:predicted RNA binding protein YcfA (HicA-like mRNA interferase family)
VKLPRDLRGRTWRACWDYVKVNQVGSHIILQTESPCHHRISIPDHKPLRIGTLSPILREVAAAKGVAREEILGSG